MKINNFFNGSEWRKWDLHVHTPASKLNNQFGDDWDLYVKALFNKAISNNISVIGITDYFCIDGYKKIVSDYINNQHKLTEIFSNELFSDEEYIGKIKSILLLPNIEFRLDKVVSSVKDGRQYRRLNYHVIFSNELDIQQIEENFLYNLDLLYEASPLSGFENRKLKKCNIEELGKKLRTEHEPFQDESDYYVGCKTAFVDIKQIDRILKKDSPLLFNNKYVMAVADDYISLIDWNGQDHNIRKTICADSNMIFSANSKTKEWALSDDFEKEFGSKKPCIWGSDAHSFDKLFNPDNDKCCWVKADTTFTGFLQLLNEPKDRVFIGIKPDELLEVESNKSHYIEHITINKVQGCEIDSKWFSNNEVFFNSHLVAIIGSKGSGKSALSDIIGLLGNSKNEKNFSFLHDERFRKKPENISQFFEAQLKWMDNSYSDKKLLSQKISNSDVERVKYLPQKYIENVCNDLGSGFEEEINRMIFSYIPENEKLGKTNLYELITYLCSTIDDKIRTKKNEVDIINKMIIQLENMNTDDYLDSIRNKRKLKYEELCSHKKQKPLELQKPNDCLTTQESARITEIDNEISKLNAEIENINGILNQLSVQVVTLSQVKDKIVSLKSVYDKTVQEIKEMLKNLGFDDIDIKPVLTYDLTEIDNKIKELSISKGSILLKLEQDSLKQTEESLYKRIELYSTEKNQIISRMNSEVQKYQNYLNELSNWRRKKYELIGTCDKEGTFKYYSTEFRYLKNKLQLELDAAIKDRNDLASEILALTKEKTIHYKNIYKHVMDCIKKVGTNSDDGISFSVEILPVQQSEDTFLGYINQNVGGSFYGKADGQMKMKEFLFKYNFDSDDGLKHFLDDIYGAISADKNKMSKLIKDRNSFYNYLFSLDYLKIEYKLKLGENNLEQLSPGEKGALLLIFYLVLDRDNSPLVIDQPEDNLDNQSVYEKLVPYIRDAKKRRQVIIVTHNPNIAVACDAEQVVFCHMNKGDNGITYESGSIENPIINKHIVDVLEGTLPAFELRKNKYKQTK